MFESVIHFVSYQASEKESNLLAHGQNRHMHLLRNRASPSLIVLSPIHVEYELLGFDI